MKCCILYCKNYSDRRSDAMIGITFHLSRLLRLTPNLITPVCCKGSKHQIAYKPYVPPCYQDHDYKNMCLKRPMSPHLTVYAPTVPAFTSVAQRATGSILTFYALLMSYGTLFLSNGIETYVCMIQSMNLGSFTIFLLKFMLGLPFCFHYFNGMRYAAWNTAKYLELKDVYATAKKAGIGGVVLAFIFAML